MKSESGNVVIGMAILSLFAVVLLALIMALVAFFKQSLPTHAVALLAVAACTSGFLLSFLFQKRKP